MFLAIDFADTLALDCLSAGNQFTDTLKQLECHIENKYIDRVVTNIGLCVWMIEIVSVESRPIMGPNDGRPCYHVVFQMAVLRPLPKELVRASIVGSDTLGLKCALGNFFQDIRVPSHMLQESSKYDEDTRLWSWKVDSGELFYEIGSNVAIRVVDVIFSRVTDCENTSNEKPKDNDDAHRAAPMLVVAAMNEPGLGPECWW